MKNHCFTSSSSGVELNDDRYNGKLHDQILMEDLLIK